MSALPRFRVRQSSHSGKTYKLWLFEFIWGRWELEVTLARRVPEIGL